MKSHIIALDAGHGGIDPGAVGVILESELTEATIGYLEEFLEQDDNYTPRLCREYEENASVAERCEAAKGAELLVSVHANSDRYASSNGFECYPAPPGRTYHEESLRFARLIVDAIQDVGITVRGIDGIRFAYYMHNENGESEKTIKESDDLTVYDAPSFGVVEKPDCPAVLIEQCFVTNANDVAKLGTKAQCKIAAARYYQAICAYFESVPQFDKNGNQVEVTKTT